jgi:hypothetical protein
MCFVDLRPKHGDQAFARDTAIAGRGEHGEQSNPRRSQSRRRGPVAGFDAKAAERYEAQHVA